MIELVVRRSVDLPAPVEDIWSMLTDPARLAEWLGAEVDLASAEPGADGRVVDAGGLVRRLVVDTVEPGRRFAFTWWPAERPEDATTVAFTLAADGQGTRLDVEEAPVARAGGRACTLALAGDPWGERLLGLELAVLSPLAVLA